jgi:GTP cyclohydrolase II
VFSPTSIELLDRARNDLRIGLPICIIDNDQNWLIFAIETISKERFSTLNEKAEFSITKRRAKTLNVTAYDQNIGRFKLDKRNDWRWVKAIADPADDLNYPMKGPFVPIRVGSPNAHKIGLNLCKQARLLPAVLAQKIDKIDKNLTSITAENVATAFQNKNIIKIVSGNFPIKVSKYSKLHIFRHENGTEENYAIEIGTPDRSHPVLCRIHSACFTGDLLGSLKCDCGAQLNEALKQMGEEQSGVLLYLNQEGRGIGLANKMRAYTLQNQGFDTVEANHRLGFEDEERDFEIAASILKNLGFNSTRLLTNNPNKIKMMNNSGIKVVERVSLNVGKTAENAHYLATKVKKSGHFS